MRTRRLEAAEPPSVSRRFVAELLQDRLRATADLGVLRLVRGIGDDSPRDRADPLQLLRSLPDLLSVIEANMSTDLPVELLPELIRLAPRVDPGSVSVIGFDSKWGAGRTQDCAVIPDVERIRAAVVSMIEDPGSAETFGAATPEAACG